MRVIFLSDLSFNIVWVIKLKSVKRYRAHMVEDIKRVKLGWNIILFTTGVALAMFGLGMSASADETTAPATNEVSLNAVTPPMQTKINNKSQAPSVVNGLQREGGSTYYYVNGVRQVGLQYINGKMYFFDPATKAQVFSQYVVNSGHTYYIGANGTAVAGLVTINGNRQYYNKDYTQARGTYVNESGKTYYMSSINGNAVKGMATINGEKQYYRGVDNSQVRGAYIYENGRTYYMSSINGNAVKGMVTINGEKQYYRGVDNTQVRGAYITDNKGWYYASSISGNMVRGLQTINGQRVFFNVDGTQVRGGSVKLDGMTYYANAIGELHTPGEVMAEQAVKMTGLRYQWGGTTRNGVDCSGFVSLVRAEAGLPGIGRVTTSQAASVRAGSTIHSVKNAKVGDLMFYGGVGSEWHVVIYVGNGKMIDSARPGTVTDVRNIWGNPDVYTTTY